MKLGRLPKRYDARTFRLGKYLSLAPVPAAANWLPAVRQGWFDSGFPETGWPMYGNDQIGDCTCAAAGHMEQVWTANASKEWTPADADIIALYKTLSGYDGSPQSDRGVVLLDLLNYWRNTGLSGHKIEGYAEAKSLDELRAAIFWFGGVILGVNLPSKAQYNLHWQEWPGDTIVGGHAVCAHAYDPAGFQIVSWGRKYYVDKEFLQRYMEESYAVFSPDWLDAQGISPSHFDRNALQADLAVVSTL